MVGGISLEMTKASLDIVGPGLFLRDNKEKNSQKLLTHYVEASESGGAGY